MPSTTTPADPATMLDNQPGRPADLSLIRAAITPGVLMACGARAFVGESATGYLGFTVGLTRSNRRCVVRLMGNDTYSVEVYRMPTRGRHAYQPVVEYRGDDITVDRLAHVVLAEADRPTP